MTSLEHLENEAFKNNIHIIEKHFHSNKIKGLYCDDVIALSSKLNDSAEKSCILAEELGHYYTTVGNILDQSTVENRKQELKARLWAYNCQIGLTGIISAYEHGCGNSHEMAEYLEVTEEFLNEALEVYRQKYGVCKEVDNYIIYFVPNLGVMKKISD